MRRYFVSVFILGCFFLLPISAQAQRAFSNQELNERISALRARLQNYQVKSARNNIDNAQDGRETVEITTEKSSEVINNDVLEEIDCREDANLTILFHDSEFFATQSVNMNEEKVLSAHEEREEEIRLRNEKFAALRQKVKMATRRAHDNAKEINGLVARLP